MSYFSDTVTAAINRDARNTNAAFSGGLAQILEDIKTDVASGNIGISANAWDVDAAAKNANCFAVRAETTTGLTLGYYGGAVRWPGAIVVTSQGTKVLSPSTTNYVEVDSAGTVSSNTSAFTAGRVPLYVVVTGASTIATITHARVLMSGQTSDQVVGSLLSQAGRTKELFVPLGTISATTTFEIIAPPGTLVKTLFSATTTVGTDNTDYWQFSMVNKDAAGTGTTDMLAAGPGNSTLAAGGSAVTAHVPRQLVLHGTGANLIIGGDYQLLFTATKNASAANLTNAKLRIDVAFTN